MPLNESQQKYLKGVVEVMIGCAESDAFHQQAIKMAEVLVSIVEQLANENTALQAELASLHDSRTAEHADLMAQNVVLTGENERLYKELDVLQGEQCPCGHDKQSGCILSQG